MNTDKKKSIQKYANFLVLLPHRDSRKLIEDYRQELFGNGFLGAYSFPPAVPLAILSRPLETEEIKKIAAETRELTLPNEGKITAGSLGLVRCPDIKPFSNLAFLGPCIDISVMEIFEIKTLKTTLKTILNTIPNTINEKIIFKFPKPIICAALLENPDTELPPVPGINSFSFRAAQIANLAIRPLSSGLEGSGLAHIGCGSYSFEWHLGRDIWLPAYSRRGVD